MHSDSQLDRSVALIVGASRGLGLAIAAEFLGRDWQVIVTARRERSAALDSLAAEFKGLLVVQQLEVTSLTEIRALRQKLEGTRLDILFVNAGVANRDVDACLVDVPDAEYAGIMLTNALGPIRILECLHDLVPEGGVAGVMSSRLGSLAENTHGTWPAYASSKAALNMLLKSFAQRYGGKRAVVAVTPGWVRTAMGGPSAELDIEESAPRVVDVLIAAAGQPGLRFLNYDGTAVDW